MATKDRPLEFWKLLNMRETPDIETASDDYASRFAGAAGAYFLKIQAAAISKIIGTTGHDTAIELGGGHGQLLPLLAQSGYETIEYGSASICHKMLRQRHPQKNQQNVTGDMVKLPFANRSVEMVIYVRLLAHIDEWPELIAESCRVSNQAVVFDYPSVVSANALTPFMFRLKKGIEKNTRNYLSFSKRELKVELAKHGFTISAHEAQFFLPMFIHRGLKGAKFLQIIEKICLVTGLTSFFGSPVILRADRIVP